MVDRNGEPAPDGGTGVDVATEMYRVRGETRATDRGDGPPVVFAHGNGFDRTMFAPQVEVLSGAYRTVAYDQRSRTEFAAEPYDLWDCVADCRALCEGLGIDSTVLVGLSYGGFMAMRLAVEHPDLLEGLVLIDSRADRHPDHQREQYASLAESALEAGEIPDATYDVMLYNYFGETTRTERTDLVDHWERRLRTYPVESVYQELHCWLEREDFTGRLQEIDVPTLVLHGEEDASIEPEHGRELAEGIPDARFETVPEAGHTPTLENPAAVTTELRAFLEDL
jgi:pimeloyl-ACP methyl ester carboxylesterase